MLRCPSTFRKNSLTVNNNNNKVRYHNSDGVLQDTAEERHTKRMETSKFVDREKQLIICNHPNSNRNTMIFSHLSTELYLLTAI